MNQTQHAALVDLFNNTERTQYFGEIYNPENNGVCAIGLMYANHPGFTGWQEYKPLRKWLAMINGRIGALSDLYEHYGITSRHIDAIYRMNDIEWLTFRTIGRTIEENPSNFWLNEK